MIPLRATLLTVLAMSAVACGKAREEPAAAATDGASDVPTAATLGDQVVLPSADYLKLPRYQDADPDYGRNLALQCRTCHILDRQDSSPLGPSLYGLFGRRAGSLEDFPYSPALAQADFVWTPRALDAWLAAPWQFLPGNRMAFAGLPDQAARDAVIAALLRMTERGADAEGA